MIFNSFNFLWLFPIIFVAYYFIPCLFTKSKRRNTKVANALLLLISYALYIQHKPAFALVLLAVTAVTYVAALVIEKNEAYGKKKYIIYTGATLALLPLAIFKYTDFVLSLLPIANWGGKIAGLNWAIPIGISFFTFQSVGYLFDVYYKRIKAEHNWWDYMLFVSFFPQILSGPISKAKDLLPQIKAERTFDYERAVQGLKWLLWGMFMKVVMADRLGLYVDKVFDNYIYNSGSSCLLATIFYTFQIYGDFAGYSLMAIGVGKVMGFDLVQNFNHPYLSTSITDFWRRWHISLSTWLKDYVYIPLGGSRCSKIRNYWNIFVTFLVSGIWHGANWTYIVWGIMHGVFQIVEKILGLQKCESHNRLVFISRILFTFILVNFTWLVFRMPTIEDTWGCLLKIFTDSGDIFLPTKKDLVFSVGSILVVAFSDIYREFKTSPTHFLYSKNSCIRWCTYIILTLSIVLCGVLDSGQFIYVSF